MLRNLLIARPGTARSSLRRVCTAAAEALPLHRRGPELQSGSANTWLREQGRTPGCIIGDKLPQVPFWVERATLDRLMRKPGFELSSLHLSLEGEIIRALPAEIQRFENGHDTHAIHITFQRWPRDAQRSPVKRRLHSRLINEIKCPAVKQGGYVHEFYSRLGIPVLLHDPDNIPQHLVIDMARHDNGDIRAEHIDVPPGVTLRPQHGAPIERQRPPAAASQLTLSLRRPPSLQVSRPTFSSRALSASEAKEGEDLGQIRIGVCVKRDLSPTEQHIVFSLAKAVPQKRKMQKAAARACARAGRICNIQKEVSTCVSPRLPGLVRAAPPLASSLSLRMGMHSPPPPCGPTGCGST